MTLKVTATLEGSFGLDALEGFTVDDLGGRELMQFAGDLEGLSQRLASGELSKRMENSARSTIALVTEVMTRELVSYLISHTPQWSGDMVTQWHVLPRGGSAGYRRSPYKVDPWESLQTDVDGPRLLSAGRYDIQAVADATATISAELDRLTQKDWIAGVTIENAHPESNAILHKGNARSAWASNSAAYAMAHVEARYGYITEASLAKLRRRRLDMRRRFGHAVDLNLPDSDERTGYTKYIDEHSP